MPVDKASAIGLTLCIVFGREQQSERPAAVVSVATASGVRRFGPASIGSEAYVVQTAEAKGEELQPSHSVCTGVFARMRERGDVCIVL